LISMRASFPDRTRAIGSEETQKERAERGSLQKDAGSKTRSFERTRQKKKSSPLKTVTCGREEKIRFLSRFKK
jgi:hypothetical protein